ncbi:MAG: arginase family protein, partial [Candidatus Anstonellales archaeon]
MAGYKLLNFLSLPNSYPYKYALIFFPYEKSTGFMKGTSKSWKEIIKQSHNIETYDFELGTNAVEKGISAFLISNKDDLKNVIEETKKHKAFNIFIGGEHTISYWSSNFFHFNTFFLFDAHADCMNLYKGKSLTHATWLRRLIEKKQKNIAFYISGLRIASKE